MSVLDLQGLESKTVARGGGHGGGGSNLTVATCASKTPSNLSVALCH
jgi:lanthionine-containing peptide SapB